jgi:hypothetical protein
MKPKEGRRVLKRRPLAPLGNSEMLECLQRSGYLLEGRIARALQNIDCFVESNLPFQDERTGISREVDMLAESSGFDVDTPKTCVKTSFIIEAINNLYPVVLLTPKGWSPFTAVEEFLHYKVTPPEETTPHPFLSECDILELHGVFGWKPFCQYCAFSRKKQGGELMASHPEDLHGSIRKVAEYLLHSKEVHHEWMNDRRDGYWRIFQWRAVIVLQNELFVCSERKTGAATLTKAKHAKLEYSLHYRDTGHTLIVDFVVENALPDFVRSIVARDKEIEESFHKKREALLVNQRQDGD